MYDWEVNDDFLFDFFLSKDVNLEDLRIYLIRSNFRGRKVPNISDDAENIVSGKIWSAEKC